MGGPQKCFVDTVTDLRPPHIRLNCPATGMFLPNINSKGLNSAHINIRERIQMRYSWKTLNRNLWCSFYLTGNQMSEKARKLGISVEKQL